jgi:hypothetical protein
MRRSRRGVPGGLAREAFGASAIAVMLVLAAGWWYLADRSLSLTGSAPQSQALRDYIEAARRGNCAAVVATLSRRSRELAQSAVGGGAPVERSFCDYSPATAKLSDFESDRVRVEDVSGAIAHVSASYTYDRFFGFYGRGRKRHTYTMVLEDGQWRVDLVEQLDRESRSNRDQRAMFLVQQAYVAITDHRQDTGALTDDPDTLRAELPGFQFPDIASGVAAASSPPETIFVTTGPSVACVSLRSASGTLVMVKIPHEKALGTYEYGARIPVVCDDRPLPRPYYGASSAIERTVSR